MAANKVEFGISNLYVGTYSVGTTGTVTMVTPYHQAGAVGFSPSASDSDNIFYADNIPYYTGYSSEAYSGDLEVAMFDDTFKTQFLGYKTLTDGGLAEVKGVEKPAVYVAFQVEGDDEKRRVIFYNCKLGKISREYSAIEENVEVATESLPVTVIGVNSNGVTMATYKPADSGYSTLFTSPAAPTVTP